MSWILHLPVAVVAERLEELKAISKRFQAYIAEIISPYDTDKLCNLERVLRVVGSIRTDGIPVALLEVNDRRYSLDDIIAAGNSIQKQVTDKKSPKSTSSKSTSSSYVTASDSERIITKYLDRRAISLESILLDNGWKEVETADGSVQKQWQRPNAPSNATPVSARQGIGTNGRPGIYNFSGNADIDADAWHSIERLFVHYKFNDNWKEAANYCHEELEGVVRVTLPSPATDNQFSVSQWREMQAENFQHTIVGLNLDTSPMGTGKSAAAMQMIASGDWGSTVYCCASHENCVEVAKKLRGHGVDVGLYPTPNDSNCIRADEAVRAMQVGLPIISTVCSDCPRYAKDQSRRMICDYHRDRKEAERKHVRVIEWKLQRFFLWLVGIILIGHIGFK